MAETDPVSEAPPTPMEMPGGPYKDQRAPVYIIKTSDIERGSSDDWQPKR